MNELLTILYTSLWLRFNILDDWECVIERTIYFSETLEFSLDIIYTIFKWDRTNICIILYISKLLSHCVFR